MEDERVLLLRKDFEDRLLNDGLGKYSIVFGFELMPIELNFNPNKRDLNISYSKRSIVNPNDEIKRTLFDIVKSCSYSKNGIETRIFASEHFNIPNTLTKSNVSPIFSLFLDYIVEKETCDVFSRVFQKVSKINSQFNLVEGISKKMFYKASTFNNAKRDGSLKIESEIIIN